MIVGILLSCYFVLSFGLCLMVHRHFKDEIWYKRMPCKKTFQLAMFLTMPVLFLFCIRNSKG